MSVAIHADQVIKRYGEITIIPGLTEHIRNGEFFTLLGPSGCGKTTLLRMIAGFNSIEGGEIRFNDTLINAPPSARHGPGNARTSIHSLSIVSPPPYQLVLRTLDETTSGASGRIP